MITHLTIENLAVVEAASLELRPGLNVLTGETGAGKSVIVDALELLRGAQRSRARLRDGAASALVEAVFLPSRETRQRLASVFEKHDLPLEEEIILGRRLESSGRTRSYVQGRLVPLGVLSEVGEELVEICGQHESHKLRTPAAQLAALDAWGDLSAEVASFSQSYDEFRGVEVRLESLRARQAELERRRDFLSYQLSELSGASVSGYSEARRRLDAARGTAELWETCAEVVQVLADGDDAVQGRVAWLARRVGFLGGGRAAALREDAEGAEASGAEVDGELGVLRDALGTIDDALSRAVVAARSLSAYGALESGELEAIEQTVSEVERLARKHRRRPEELETLALELGRELAELEGLEAELPRLELEVRERRAEVERVALLLHGARLEAARRLGAAITAELEALCFTGASLEVRVAQAALGALGVSAVELFFRANPGQAPAPLGRVASGGELSRVLLALRAVSRHGGGLSVFDEIDAGAGGHVAERIGERLRLAARSGQVLCVTHWPQVAAHADGHFVVQKSSGENTFSLVARVEGELRVDELSRMLGGSRASARSHASHLLSAAGHAERAAPATRGEAALTDAAPAGRVPRLETERSRAPGKRGAAKSRAA